MIEGVVCVCSRGLMMSRTAESIDRNKETIYGFWMTEYTHDLPIPDAQNQVTEQALKHNPEYIWYVEEDVVPPFNALKKMVEYSITEDCPVVSAWYRLNGGLKSFEIADNGTLLFSGLGCLLVKTSALRQLEKPYFRTDTVWTPDYHEGKLIRSNDREGAINYGKQDIHFFGTLHEAGIVPRFIDIECLHLIVKKYGEPRSNNGSHVIVPKG